MDAFGYLSFEEIKRALKKASPEEETGLIIQLQEMQMIKKLLAKELGERIILKY